MRWTKHLLALGLTAALTACKDSGPTNVKPPGDTSTTPVPKPWTNGPLTINSLGLGPVAERITAEVAVDGDVAYTTTWSCRSAGLCGNAVKIWNVAGSTPVLVDSLIAKAAGRVRHERRADLR